MGHNISVNFLMNVFFVLFISHDDIVCSFLKQNSENFIINYKNGQTVWKLKNHWQ